MDYGREVTFGYFLIPNAADPLLDIAREVERRGLDSIGIQDHPYQRRFVDRWTLMGMIAAVTSRVTIFPDVANLPLRPPAVLAKSAASLDLLSGGRFELGLGAGGFWDAIEAYGGPRRSPGEAYAALDEAIDVIRKVWSGERNLRFDGTYYHLGCAHSGANSGPLPAHPIGIWLGVHGPRALRLTGATADGWVPSFRGEVKQLVVAPVNSSGVAAWWLVGPGGWIGEVEAAGAVEGFLRGAGGVAGGQDAGLVVVVAGPVDGEAPGVCGSAVAQAA